MPKTEKELAEAAKHISYEWGMLRGAAESDWHRLPVTAGSFQKLINSNARTELVLLHARLLYDFLFTFSDDGDDVQAPDFLEGAAATNWRKDRPRLAKTYCPILTKDRRRLNKRLFHLSYKRETLPKGWDMRGIVAELSNALQYFKSQLSPQRVKLLFTV